MGRKAAADTMRAMEALRELKQAEAPAVEDSAETPEGSVENPHPRGSPEYYLWELNRVEDQVREGAIEPLDAQRTADFWRKQAQDRGINLTDWSMNQLDPIRRLLLNPELLEHQEKDLREIRKAILEVEAMDRREVELKKKWVELIDLTLWLQQKAKESVAKFAIYVMRCQRTAKVLHMEKMHLDLFRIWMDPDVSNSLIEAPPGVGKTTCLYAVELWEIAHDPRLRFLKQCCDKETAIKRVQVVREYIQSRRFRALFPDVRIDYTRPCTASQFTVVRPNPSQDPTMQAAGSLSEIQGAGFDRIHADDLCPQKVQWEKATRDRITQRFHSTTLTRRRSVTDARVRYIATPWHVDDCTCRLLRDIRDGLMPSWRADVFPVREDATGNPIAPVPWPEFERELLRIRRTHPETYACCYRLNPQDRSIRRLEKLVYWDVEGGTSPYCPVHKRDECRQLRNLVMSGERWLALDPAAGGGDQTGMVGFSLMADGRAAITYADFLPGRAHTVAEQICQAVVQQKTDMALIEAASQGKGVADMWGAYLVARLGDAWRNKVIFGTTKIGGGRGKGSGQNIKKTERFWHITPYLVNGTVLFPGKWRLVSGIPRLGPVDDDRGLVELHDQLMNFPNVAHDDGVDCVSMFINHHLGRLIRSVEESPAPEVEVKIDKPKGVNILSILYKERRKRQKKEADLRLARATYGHRGMEAELFAAWS